MTCTMLVYAAGYVICSVGFIGLVNLTRGAAVMGLRKKFFKDKDFQEKKEVKQMNDDHKKAFGTEMNDMG